MAFRSALVDRAYLQRRGPAGVPVNGRTPHALTEGPAIRCRLTLAATTERKDRGRKVAEPHPTLTLDRRDADREPVVPQKSDRLRIVSAELGEGVWEIDGVPPPIRKKRKVIGWTVTVTRLEED